MCRYDGKYPWYIALKSMVTFLGPLLAAVIPSVAIFLVDQKASVSVFSVVLLGLVLGSFLLGVTSTKMDMVIRKKNYFVAYGPVQKKAVSKVLDVDYAFLETAEGKKLADQARSSYELDWYGWNRIMDMFTPFAFNLLGIVVYTAILIPKCPWVLPVFFAMSAMNLFLERKVSRKGWNMHRNIVNEADSRTNYFFQRSTSVTDGKDIRLFSMENWFSSIMEFLIQKRLRAWKWIEVAYFVPNFSDTIWTLVRDLIAYCVLVHSFLQGKLDAASFTLYLGIITGFSGWLNGGNMGEGLVRANSEMMRCSWWITSYRNFLEQWSPEEEKIEKRQNGKNSVSELQNGGKSEMELRNGNYSNAAGERGGNTEQKVENLIETGVTIEFRDVCFRYPGAQKDVIHHLNLKVQAGENIALVGVNGAGKTTLVKLLCGFYRPDSGQIYINGKEISAYPARTYRALLGAVFQDRMLMAASVEENVACCREEEVDREKLWRVLRQADIEEKIRSLAKQEKTMVTNFLEQDGILFSGGEIQRIILARALYKDAPLLLLDEPTSALDPMAEYEIYAGFDQLVAKNLAVYISHRMSSCRFCERILVLEQGRIAEEGNHEALLAKNGIYARMWNLQAKNYQ